MSLFKGRIIQTKLNKCLQAMLMLQASDDIICSQSDDEPELLLFKHAVISFKHKL